LLKGKARCCGAPISAQYPLVEAATAALCLNRACISAGAGALWLLVFVSFLLILAVIDYHRQLLPDVLTLPLLWIGLLFNLQSCFVSLPQATIGAAGYLCLWCLFWLFKLLTGKDALGYGDFKLLAALGAWRLASITPCGFTGGDKRIAVCVRTARRGKKRSQSAAGIRPVAGLSQCGKYAAISGYLTEKQLMFARKAGQRR
jgi:general secretion pathway protein O